MKGLARKNTHVKYESPSTYQSKVMTKVIVWKRRSNYKVKDQRVKVMVSNERSCLKEYTCESPSTYESKLMTKVKVLEKKVKLQGQKLEVKVMVSNEKSYQKEYTCEICKP
jgi:hypothetical protein